MVPPHPRNRSHCIPLSPRGGKAGRRCFFLFYIHDACGDNRPPGLGLDFGLRNTHGVGVVGRPRITHVLSRRTVVDGVLERGPIVPILAWRATGIGFGVSELKFRYLQIVVLFPYSPLRGP